MRELLPSRRRSELISFEHEGLRFHGSVSRYSDGRIAEFFLDLEKPGGTAGIAARDAAVAASLALQFGCPVATLRRALTRLTDGSAAGPLGRLLDLVEREPDPIQSRVDRIARDVEPPLSDKVVRLIELADEIENGGRE
jgi:hypothetical protein